MLPVPIFLRGRGLVVCREAPGTRRPSSSSELELLKAMSLCLPLLNPYLDVTVGNLSIICSYFQGQMELRKRLEEVRLLESRKSARLMDQDTDFARLADMAGDRKRTSSHCIDVPTVQG